MSDQVSHPCKTTGKRIVLYILIVTFLGSRLEDNRFCTEWYQAFPDFSLFLISFWIKFWFVKVVPKYLNASTLWKELSTISILWLHLHSDLETWPCRTSVLFCSLLLLGPEHMPHMHCSHVGLLCYPCTILVFWTFPFRHQSVSLSV